jgi:hypothetical protein
MHDALRRAAYERGANDSVVALPRITAVGNNGDHCCQKLSSQKMATHHLQQTVVKSGLKLSEVVRAKTTTPPPLEKRWSKVVRSCQKWSSPEITATQFKKQQRAKSGQKVVIALSDGSAFQKTR